MAQAGRGGGNFGDGRLPFQAWAESLPVCTRVWTIGMLVVSVLVQCRLLTPFQLFFSMNAVVSKGQYWRLVSSFFYFGPLSLDLFFHVYFVQRYCRLLETSTNMTIVRFSWMVAYAMVALLVLAPAFKITFLGVPLSNVLVYIWGRKNPESILSLMGLFHIRAPSLPWVFFGFNLLMMGAVPRDDLAGIVVGHVWYFFNDVYPYYFDGSRPLDPPAFWEWAMLGLTDWANIPGAGPIEDELQFLEDDDPIAEPEGQDEAELDPVVGPDGNAGDNVDDADNDDQPQPRRRREPIVEQAAPVAV